MDGLGALLSGRGKMACWIITVPIILCHVRGVEIPRIYTITPNCSTSTCMWRWLWHRQRWPDGTWSTSCRSLAKIVLVHWVKSYFRRFVWLNVADARLPKHSYRPNGNLPQRENPTRCTLQLEAHSRLHSKLPRKSYSTGRCFEKHSTNNGDMKRSQKVNSL